MPNINDTVASLLKLLAECEALAESQEETRGELAALIRQAQANAAGQALAEPSERDWPNCACHCRQS